MESTGRRVRREFTAAYKTEVVDLCRTSGKTVGAVARDLGLTATAVRDGWPRPRSIAAGVMD